jgi:hypothetical protein
MDVARALVRLQFFFLEKKSLSPCLFSTLDLHRFQQIDASAPRVICGDTTLWRIQGYGLRLPIALFVIPCILLCSFLSILFFFQEG